MSTAKQGSKSTAKGTPNVTEVTSAGNGVTQKAETSSAIQGFESGAKGTLNVTEVTSAGNGITLKTQSGESHSVVYICNPPVS